MRNILKNRYALSTVVTTLIILVVSVLLAGVVTYFAINVTSTRVQEESLHLTKQHVWYAANGTDGYVGQAAIMIINTGGRDVVIDKLTVRGQECAWTSVYYNITSASISDDLTFQKNLGGTMNIGTTPYEFVAASTDLTLESGKTMMIYINNPDSITVNDIGLTVAQTIFTSQAMYYKETNVESS
jgi:Na+-transporting NADH:ubiquinone oxidoreductase subunit NqrB